MRTPPCGHAGARCMAPSMKSDDAPLAQLQEGENIFLCSQNLYLWLGKRRGIPCRQAAAISMSWEAFARRSQAAAQITMPPGGVENQADSRTNNTHFSMIGASGASSRCVGGAVYCTPVLQAHYHAQPHIALRAYAGLRSAAGAACPGELRTMLGGAGADHRYR